MESRQQIPLTEDMRIELRSIVAEIDHEQLAITSKLTPAQRFEIGASISRAALDAAIYRLRSEDPSLSRDEAQREALRRYYETHPSTYLPQE